MVIHDTQERILKQIYERRLEEFKMRMEYLNIELRMEMGGDRVFIFQNTTPHFK
jgi:hypothetical protein